MAEPTQNPQSNLKFRVVSQFIKDFSFENPIAPNLAQIKTQPNISINVNVDVITLEDNYYQVNLTFNCKSDSDNKTLFICELTYSGVFNIENIQDDYVELMLYIECPRLLFPFARSIISKTTQDGGFPPLFIDPIDFAALYQYNMGKTVTPPKENVTN